MLSAISSGKVWYFFCLESGNSDNGHKLVVVLVMFWHYWLGNRKCIWPV